MAPKNPRLFKKCSNSMMWHSKIRVGHQQPMTAWKIHYPNSVKPVDRQTVKSKITLYTENA